MNIQTCNALFEDGTLSALYKTGFLNTKIFTYREIYLWVQYRVRTCGLTKNQAVLEAEIHFNRDERTIWRPISCFET